MAQPALKALWSTLTAIGPRRVTRFIARFPAYSDTAFYYDGVAGHVALTIDDGLARGGAGTSLVAELQQLLARHDARATFFVCAEYLRGVESEAAALVAAGHELANHLGEDRQGHYPRLPEAAFEAELRRASAAIEAIDGAAPCRWFRAPQGLYTRSMARVVRRAGMAHALGDVYCDDWALSRNASWAARTMLRQARPGSIVITHMPEVGFRRHTLESLSLLLDGLSARGLKVVTLTTLRRLADERRGGAEHPVSVRRV